MVPWIPSHSLQYSIRNSENRSIPWTASSAFFIACIEALSMAAQPEHATGEKQYEHWLPLPIALLIAFFLPALASKVESHSRFYRVPTKMLPADIRIRPRADDFTLSKSLDVTIDEAPQRPVYNSTVGQTIRWSFDPNLWASFFVSIGYDLRNKWLQALYLLNPRFILQPYRVQMALIPSKMERIEVPAADLIQQCPTEPGNIAGWHYPPFARRQSSYLSAIQNGRKGTLDLNWLSEWVSPPTPSCPRKQMKFSCCVRGNSLA
jgi:hypothetical protein